MGKFESAAPLAIERIDGKPFVGLGQFDLNALGYSLHEYFISGDAKSYSLDGAQTVDGVWKLKVGASAPYKTRVEVVTPDDPKRFNGTVLVEWINVSPGTDIFPVWRMAHREMLRDGYAYVAISAQKAGLDGAGIMAGPDPAVKVAHPERYGVLQHPGDAYSYDIFSQGTRAVKYPGRVDMLGGLKPSHVLALGQSQSAFFLTSYINGVDPLVPMFDGYMLAGWFGSGAPFDNKPLSLGDRQPARIRDDVRVPVMVVQSETEMNSFASSLSKLPDGPHMRVWEVAGAAHMDTYTFTGFDVDSGTLPVADLATAMKPVSSLAGVQLPHLVNGGPQNHYVMEAALAKLNDWVVNGTAPPIAPRIDVQAGKPPVMGRDDLGIGKGGIRTPWVDVPSALFTGFAPEAPMPLALFGSTTPFDKQRLNQLYPGGKADYLRKFKSSTQATIAAGFVLPADEQEIIGLAEKSYPE